MINGQELLCSKIEHSTLDTFPRTLMLIGPKGSGKHMLCTEVSNHFGLPAIELTDNISLEVIDEIYLQAEPFVYIIDLDKISIKEQNMLLKFLEEPLSNAFIILLSEAGANVLKTVFNRCQQWRLAPYSIDFLSVFTDNEQILSLATTPGQILDFLHSDFNQIFELADKITLKISAANLPNALTITNKLGFKDERDKINPHLLIKALLISFNNQWKLTGNRVFLNGYKRTMQLSIDSKIRNVDMKYLIDRYIIELREIMRVS